MIGYVTLGTNDLDRAAGFCDALLDVIGTKRMMDEAGFVAWGTTPEAPSIAALRRPNRLMARMLLREMPPWLRWQLIQRN